MEHQPQTPPENPALPETPAPTAEQADIPKAFIPAPPDAAALSYPERAALYLTDPDQYHHAFGGKNQWK